MKKGLVVCSLVFLFGVSLSSGHAQAHRTKKISKPAPAIAPSPDATPTPPAPSKKNDRPVGETPDVAHKTPGSQPTPEAPAYFYEFTRPGFTYSHIVIEHDEAGKGKISLTKDGSTETITDPIELTAVTLGKINDFLSRLNFLDSTENYQYPHDFSNMGNVVFTFEKGGRRRTVKYNWSENKDAKGLMDEYRRISNEYTWHFEISLARQNQPLQTPGIMDELDSFISRGEISDPPHLIPVLTELSNDERMPLMARNRAAKLVKQIGKSKK